MKDNISFKKIRFKGTILSSSRDTKIMGRDVKKFIWVSNHFIDLFFGYTILNSNSAKTVQETTREATLFELTYTHVYKLCAQYK